MNRKLAEQLCLKVEEHNSTFQETSGANVHFVGQLPRTRFQFQDTLALVVEDIQVFYRSADFILIILRTNAFYPQGWFLHQCHLEERWNQPVVDIKATDTRIIYKLIAAGPQSKQDLGPSIHSTNGKEVKEKVDLYIQVYAVLGDGVWANIKKLLEGAKLNDMKGGLG